VLPPPRHHLPGRGDRGLILLFDELVGEGVGVGE
jgi:hypothetical protein